VLDEILQGVPEDERAKVVGLNTAKWYDFDLEVVSQEVVTRATETV
jgi:hypothetical protein